MIQTKWTLGARRDQPGDRIMGESRADLRLEAGHRDPRVAGDGARRLDSLRQRRQPGEFL